MGGTALSLYYFVICKVLSYVSSILMNSATSLFCCSFIVQGGSGFARNITFERIRMMDLKTPIVIDQSYGTMQVNNYHLQR